MRRREFIGGFVALGAVTPKASAQSSKHVIGMLGPVRREDYEPRIARFREGLRQAGIADAASIPVEYLWPGPANTPWSELAAELVRRRVSVITTGGDDPPQAAKAATET